MSFGDGDLHVIVAQLKTENARLKHRNGELKSLVRDMHGVMWACRERDCKHREKGCWRVYGEGDGDCWLEKRMSALGIEVDE